MCLRALEKMVYQLLDSKEQAELLSASALQPLDVNADGKHSNPVTAYIKGHLTSCCAFITRLPAQRLCLTGFTLHICHNSFCKRIMSHYLNVAKWIKNDVLHPIWCLSKQK